MAAPTQPRILLACDFDWSVVDEDSDHYVLERLAPDLLKNMKEWYASGQYQWTDLVDELLKELHGRGVSSDEIASALHTIPFNPAMKQALDTMAFQGHEVIIISDANTFYINEIVKAKQISTNFSLVITNGAHVDPTGRLRVTRHTTDPPHGCNRCSVNLCKGKELLTHINSCGPFSRIMYLGDGRNDYCPSTKLTSSDLVLARNGRALADMLRDPSTRANVSASVLFWDSAADVLRIVKETLSCK